MDPLKATDNPRYRDLVFVVEDDLDVSRLVEHNLRTAAYEVATFSSGALVVASTTMNQPGLFLLDITLPGSMVRSLPPEQYPSKIDRPAGASHKVSGSLSD